MVLVRIDKSGLFFLLMIVGSLNAQPKNALIEKEGAWIRSDVNQKTIYLCFTAHDYTEGIDFISTTLQKEDVKASFFLTGDFVRNQPIIAKKLFHAGHYVGPHSDKHLLYCDWDIRDRLLVSLDSIKIDLDNNISKLHDIGIPTPQMTLVMPPYEWYNSEIAQAMKNWGYTLVNYTPGTSSNADYTTPDMKNYLTSDSILTRIYRVESQRPFGLNGYHLLLHVGTAPLRTDKLYFYLPTLIKKLKSLGYSFARF